MATTKQLTLDINKDMYQTIDAKQNDTKSRFIEFTLIDNSLPYDLTDSTVKIFGNKPDNTIIFNNVTITDATNGIVTVELTSQALAVVGALVCELVIYGSDSSILSSKIFIINVTKSIRSDSAVESQNEFTLLTAALASLAEYDSYKSEIQNARQGSTDLLTNLQAKDSQLADIATVYINSFPKLNGETYDTQRIQRAIDAIKNGNHYGIVELTPGTTFYLDGTIQSYKGIILRGKNTIFNCANFDTTSITKNVIEFNSGSGTGWTRLLAMSGIKIIGDTSQTDGNYKSQLNGLGFKVGEIIIRDVDITGLDKTVVFYSNAYLIGFDTCHFRQNNYGFHYDGSSITNSGENITLDKCIIGNNNYGIYNKWGDITLNMCSIDYNHVNQIADNINRNGANQIIGQLKLNLCHIENLTDNVNLTRIINHGYLILTNCNIVDYSHKWLQTLDTVIIDNPKIWGISTSNYLCTSDSTGTIKIKSPIAIDPTINNLITPKLSNIPDSDFELADTSMWTVTDGTVTKDNTKYSNGTQSLKITSGQFTTGYVLSKKIPIPATFNRFILSIMANTKYCTASITNTIYFYDLDNNLLSSTIMSIGVNASDTFVYAKTVLSDIPRTTVYATIKLYAGGIGTSVYVNYDDIYLTLI